MDQLLKMAADSGMTKEQGEAATGGIFSLVKKGLDSGDFSKIVKKIPEVEGLIKEHETSTKAAGTGGAGDLVGSAMSAIGGGKSGAGGSADTAGGSAGGIASLLASLSSKGVSAKELNKFMPQVVSLVKTQAGVDISKILGVSATPSTGGTADPASAESKNPMSRFMGMFGKKQKA
jgi:hypothetical protein